MRMSTKGRLAVNALIDLALREAAGPVALLSISQRQQVSLSYLEQMFSRLRREGIVESTRGPGGGYTLGRAPSDINVAEVVMAVDEGEESPRTGLDDAVSQRLWREAEAAVLNHLATVTLQQLLDDHVAQGAQPAQPVVRARLAPQPAPVGRLPLRCSAPNSVFAFGQSFAG